MQETMLVTGLFVAGVGAGALLSYARDRKLLRLYGHLVEDLSGMISRRKAVSPEAAAAKTADQASGADARQKYAS